LKIELILLGQENVYPENEGESPIKLLAINIISILDYMYHDVSPIFKGNFKKTTGLRISTYHSM
jgi:hypothetical protein